MLAHCYDPRSPLFAGAPTDGRPRLPEPSPPPWMNPDVPLPEFYRPIISRRWRTMGEAYAAAGATLLRALIAAAPPPVPAAPPLVPAAAPVAPAGDWE
jgi:hypothetical protein